MADGGLLESRWAKAPAKKFGVKQAVSMAQESHAAQNMAQDTAQTTAQHTAQSLIFDMTNLLQKTTSTYGTKPAENSSTTSGAFNFVTPQLVPPATISTPRDPPSTATFRSTVASTSASIPAARTINTDQRPFTFGAAQPKTMFKFGDPTARYKLDKSRYLRYLQPNAGGRSGEEEEIRTAPLFSLAVKHIVDDPDSDSSGSDSDTSQSSAEGIKRPGPAARQVAPILPQYGLLGFNIGQHSRIAQNEPIMLNMNAPNSTFICGSQGSGKSYTLSCLLENCLLPDSDLGKIDKPVAGVLFHYDLDASGSVAEAANLCSRGIKVHVLVSESNFFARSQKYKVLTGAKKNLDVQMLKLNPSDLSVERMHKLMAFSEKGGSVPLYMETIQRILRMMAVSNRGQPFSYDEFLRHLAKEELRGEQTSPMRLRLGLLESFMRWSGDPKQRAKMESTMPKNLFDLQPGTLTIVDLTDPFVDPATVCVLFDICLSLCKEKRPDSGLVVALDEAHKYMEKESAAANNFTTRLLTTIREQRHNATRVIIATQEPTISERLLDLCSVTIVHGFKSPAWFTTIRNHLGGASRMVYDEEADGEQLDDGGLFQKIVQLGCGQSLVFAPTAYVCEVQDAEGNGYAQKLGTSVMKMMTRKRTGVDAGRSVLASSGVEEVHQLEEKVGGFKF